jgi:hypothetical protein
MYNPAIQFEILGDIDLDSYYFHKQTVVGPYPIAFLSKKPKGFQKNKIIVHGVPYVTYVA